MLRKHDIDHILRAAAAITVRDQFIIVGSGAVIATARHIPASMMLTRELDLYTEGPDSEDLSVLIDATIGAGSMFHRTFGYYADGVGPDTSVMPADWKSRALTYSIAGSAVQATCPCPDDIAIAKMVAWREKDIAWLGEAFRAQISRAAQVEALIIAGLPPPAPDEAEMLRRLGTVTPPARPVP